MSGHLTHERAPVAVRLIDIDGGIQPLSGCNGYRSIMVYFRRNGTVIGRGLFPLTDGAISKDVLSSAVREIDSRPKTPHPAISASGVSSSAGTRTVTIAVCTRDRASLLRKCLESLVALDRDLTEIIVVDNCPSDDSTKNLVSEFKHIRYALCALPGLDRARNLAIRLARTEIIAFTDDDARVDRNWLRNIIANFDDPMVAVVTGITLPAELDTEAQIDFELGTSFIRGFQAREFTFKNSNPLLVAGMGAGANMAIRTSLVEEIGGFDEHLDGGTPTKSGGDHELFSRALTAGYRIVYDPSAIVWHCHKRTREELIKTLYGYGVGVFAWWTKALVKRGELGVVVLAPMILTKYHVKRVLESLFRKDGSPALCYTWAELRGALVGCFAYFRSRLTAE